MNYHKYRTEGLILFTKSPSEKATRTTAKIAESNSDLSDITLIAPSRRKTCDEGNNSWFDSFETKHQQKHVVFYRTNIEQQ